MRLTATARGIDVSVVSERPRSRAAHGLRRLLQVIAALFAVASMLGLRAQAHASPPAPVGVPIAAREPAALLLPPPGGDPRLVTSSTDPVVAVAEADADPALYPAIASALERSPAARSALAEAQAAAASAREARAALRPSLEAALSGERVIARGYSNDPGNIIERLAPGTRADLSLTAEQLLWDGGASIARRRAADLLAQGERANAEAAATDAALDMAAAWIALRETALEAKIDRDGVKRAMAILDATRIRAAAGVDSGEDVARAAGMVAAQEGALARALGAQSSATARFFEAFGRSPPPLPGRPRGPEPPPGNVALRAFGQAPAARSERARAEAGKQEAEAARAERGPRVLAGIDAVRYGAFDPVQDHDIRARLTLRQPILTGGAAAARTEGAAARAKAAAFAADRVAAEAARDAEIASAELGADLSEATAAREAYLAARRVRDAYAERFRLKRGAVLELLRAEADLVAAAVAYLRAIAAGDLARFTLAARTGDLLGAIGA